MRGKSPLRRMSRGRKFSIIVPDEECSSPSSSPSSSQSSPSLSSSEIESNAYKALSKASKSAKTEKKRKVDDDDDTSNNLTSDKFFFSRNDSNFGFDLQRTWSVNDFSTSNNSLGVSNNSVGDVYLEEDGSDGSNDNDIACNVKVKRKLKGMSQARRGRRKRNSNKIKIKNNNNSMNDAMPKMIPEGKEDVDTDEEDDEGDSDGKNDNIALNLNMYGYNFSGSGIVERRTSMLSNSLTTATMTYDDDIMLDSGYNSDTALIRKRLEIIQEQHEVAQRKQKNKRSSSRGKKKKSTKKIKSEKKNKKKDKKKAGSSSTSLTSISDDEVLLCKSVHLDVDDDISVSKKKKKKKKTKRNSKKEKNKKDNDAATAFSSSSCSSRRRINIGDITFKEYDRRLEELEKLESRLSEERVLFQKECEVIAFERDSMEVQLNEEFEKSEELIAQVKELERIIQSQKMSNADNGFELEMQLMKVQYENQKDELEKKLAEKEAEIETLQHNTRNVNGLYGIDNRNNEGDRFESLRFIDNGKSRERLQGELLQTITKLTEKESQLKQQTKDLDVARDELDSLREGNLLNELRNDLSKTQKEKENLENALHNEQKLRTTKLKEKDETIMYLMGELARLKQEQSLSNPRPLVR